MFSLKYIILTGVITAGVSAPVVLGGSASAANGSCTLEAVRPNVGEQIAQNRKFTQKGNRVYIKVEVKGKNCAKVVTLEAWKAPNATDGRPFKEQVLFRHITRTLDAGSHLLSVQLPNCYYQVDLIHGSKTMGANGEIKFDSARMIGSVHGGNKVCTVTTPDTPDEPEVPETPVTPVTPPTTTITTTTSSSVTTLPKTGAGSIVAGIFGSVSALGTAAHYFVRRKLLNA
jgi:LPXTG-motif cell wall-anchored protein